MLYAPPPTRHLSSAEITFASAAEIVGAYAEASEKHPHLHPNAQITPDGLRFDTETGAKGNRVMQYTRRIAAALRGEYLEPLEPEEDEEDATAVGTGGWKLAGEEGVGAGEGGDWQDMASYQAEQSIEIGEIGPRTNVIQEGGEEPEIEATTDEGRKRKKDRGDDDDGQANTKVDKEARKKAKRERALQQRRENAKKAE
jgi:hypothetical protein